MNDVAHFARFDEREALGLERCRRIVARCVVDERFQLPQMLAQGIGAQQIAAALQHARKFLRHEGGEDVQHLVDAPVLDRQMRAGGDTEREGRRAFCCVLERGLGNIDAYEFSRFARLFDRAQHSKRIDALAAARVEHRGLHRCKFRRRIRDGCDEAVVIALVQKVAPCAHHQLVVPVVTLRGIEQEVDIATFGDVETVVFRAEICPCAPFKRPGADGAAQLHHQNSPTCCGSSPRPSERSCC